MALNFRSIMLVTLVFYFYCHEELGRATVTALDSIYSIGNFKYQDLATLDDRSIPSTTERGVYFLPHEIPYNGTLAEIEVCAFVSENFDPSIGRNVQVRLAIYRRESNVQCPVYSLLNNNAISIRITPEDGNLYGCNNVQQLDFSILEGDRIGVMILNSNDCHPNLVSPNCSQVLFVPSASVSRANITLEYAEPIGQFLNMNITINATQNIQINDSEVQPTTCLNDSLPIAPTCTVDVSEDQPQSTPAGPTMPQDETTSGITPELSTGPGSRFTSWTSIFVAVVGTISVVVILICVSMVAMLTVAFKVVRKRKATLTRDSTNHKLCIQNNVNIQCHEPNSRSPIPCNRGNYDEALAEYDEALVEYDEIEYNDDQMTSEETKAETLTLAQDSIKENLVHTCKTGKNLSVPLNKQDIVEMCVIKTAESMFNDEPDVKQDDKLVQEYDYDQMMQSGEVEDTLNYENEEEYFVPATREDELKEQLQRLKIRVILNTDLQVRQQIGSGQFGSVHRGVWHHSDHEDNSMRDEEVAVKSMKVGASEEERAKFLQEATIMGQFNHPNVVSILGIVLEEPRPLQIVMDIMDKGDLHHHLQTLRPIPVEPVSSTLRPTLLSYSRQIAFGLMYLHDVKKFVHRDLAARNILVANSGTCKIADFGMSRDLQDENYYVAHGGMIPVKWTAPEALMYRKYSSASDIWSYGCLLYEIWSLGYRPFHDVTNAEAVKKVENGYCLPPPPGCPRAIYHIMMKCWHLDASSRPNPSNVVMGLSHPDFQILNWSTKDSHNNSEEARTLGASIEAGHSLFPDLQKTYT